MTEQSLKRSIAFAVLVLPAFFAAAVLLGFGGQSLSFTLLPSVLVAVGLALLLFFVRRLDPEVLTFRFRPAAWQLYILTVLGLALRIGVALAVRPTPVSDMASYDFSARHLVAAHEYICREGPYLLHAYRPPGVAFLLAGAMLLTGMHWWSALLLNCSLFGGACIFLWLAGQGPRRWNALMPPLTITLLALWPSDIAVASLPQSETPTVLISAALIFVLARISPLWLEAMWLGLITGLSCLIRNSNLVLVGVWILVLLLKPAPLARRIAVCALMVVCVIAPIAPWSIRNYSIFHVPVLVATNGGENLWSANNSTTAGSYDGESLKQTRQYLPDEVAMDQAGFRLAKNWIRTHPTGFLRLGVQKVRMLLGSDGWGWYYALERGVGYTGPWYRAAVLAADFWWLLVWLAIAAGLSLRWGSYLCDDALLAIVAFTFVPALLFFIFQSQPRYHAFMIPGLLWLATAWIARAESS